MALKRLFSYFKRAKRTSKEVSFYNVDHHWTEAIENNKINDVKTLIEKGANPSHNYNYAIRFCCDENYIEIAQYLITLDNVDIMALQGQSIIRLLRKGHFELFQMLIVKKGFCLNDSIVKELIMSPIRYSLLILSLEEDFFQKNEKFYPKLIIHILSEIKDADEELKIRFFLNKNYYYGSDHYVRLDEYDKMKIMANLNPIETSISILEG